MHVFVAGATGVLGRRIVPLLVGQGHQVTALTRRTNRAGLLRTLGAHPAVADAFDAASLAAAVKQASPDVIMNQLTDLSAGNIAANAALWARGTRNLMDAAHAADVGRVISQSIAWAYEPGSTTAGEQTPLDLGAPQPRRTPVHAVATLEQFTQEATEWVVLRYGMLYGPDTWYEPQGSKAADARAGRLAPDDNIISFVHVDDAAVAAAQALAWPSGPVNICDDEPAAGREWVPAFCRAVDAPVPGLNHPDAREPWARGADNHQARTQLAWSPRYPSWRQGFRAMASGNTGADISQ
jgi:nucleoside-diphosphate-sugar epimerase